MRQLKRVKQLLTMYLLILLNCSAYSQKKISDHHNLQVPPLRNITIDDPFWSPKLKIWRSKTIYDVFDKFEGKYQSEREPLIVDERKIGRTRNAFLNFDMVAEGKKGIHKHDGPEWYDGLVYETIRAAGDFLAEYPDSTLEERVNGYIDRIAAAQAVDSNGFVLTHTILMEPDHRWGTNGGFERGQHDLYDAGMLAEAAVHYYYGTGKVKLLNVAVKLCNYMVKEMGPAPKKNIIPGHAGPEEALMKLYWLFKEQPELKAKMSEVINETDYYNLAKFWIESRGDNCGLPDWDHWEYKVSDQWIRDAKYEDPKFGNHSRPAWGSYAQDQSSVFNQKTIEGHAVRATLLGTGIVAAALENNDSHYIATAENYWNNMAGKRMFITGGVGAIAHDEKFGPDYFLPENAYLETCAAVGAGFFSQRMNQLEAKGEYIDEFERSLYNNILSGVSLNGDHYSYENPLIGSGHQRWNWHECPCCPPMFLKMISALPQYIYAYDDAELYVNLFIGSHASLKIEKTNVVLIQKTEYPLKGNSTIEVTPSISSNFTINIRIPGWAIGKENAFDLYNSNLKHTAVLKVNGKPFPLHVKNGYAAVKRQWKKGDKIKLDLPMQPRLVFANNLVDSIKNKVAIASGPIVYCIEEVDNPDAQQIVFNSTFPMQLMYKPDFLNGTNTIIGRAIKSQSKDKITFVAIPFYLVGNRMPGSYYRVWLPYEKK